MARSSWISSISLAICVFVSCSLRRSSCWSSSVVLRVAGSTRSWRQSSPLLGLLMVSGMLGHLADGFFFSARSVVQDGLFFRGLGVLQGGS
jgi:hypothetical protein